jgi:peptidoglycan LD-endopeptidase LytH
METDELSPLSGNHTAVRTTKKLLMVYYLIAIHVVAVFLVIDKVSQRYTIERREPEEDAYVPTPSLSASPETNPPAAFTPASTVNNPLPSPPAVPSSALGLIIPVQGIKADKLTDTFSDSRSEGRVHDAIDIMAPAGTPVLAAADGEIAKFFDSKAGGITIYEISKDKKYVYYYAHLQSRAADIHEGDQVSQGRVIGFVGDTGNAGAGNYHLHFGISEVTDPKRYWGGTPINPYPLLRH